ncbi:hypothetical protein [Planktothrix mougeotii]|uniref:Uncharacterized protein n=1 Tax=Planktothrix mougeotii LEGE 06226 TaxID=1828728 RepID=A0ABR9U6L4_9CYAN|nr:hypothetical protein [Planktothrix mougeotii]MBE9142103.1 hypothetical protein [Planktothrix mougeotii LEGE 06226]
MAANNNSGIEAVVTEFGFLGTIATGATLASQAGIGTVVVATIGGAAGATAIAVSLPAIAGVCAAIPLGLSIGNRAVEGVRYLTNRGGTTSTRLSNIH